jgi:hypothetical protein
MNSSKFKFMKTTKLMRCALFAAFLAAFGLVGCENWILIQLTRPLTFRARLTQLPMRNPIYGDTTYINIATPIVGPKTTVPAGGPHSPIISLFQPTNCCTWNSSTTVLALTTGTTGTLLLPMK